MNNIWEQLATAGLPALLMAIAIRWLVAANEKQQQGNKELMLMLNQERTDRIEALEGEVQVCKEHIRECDTDRHNLRAELVRIAQSRRDDDEMPRDPPTKHYPRSR